MLIFWLHAATSSTHYFFFFFRRAAKSEPSSLPSLSASSLLCFGDIFFALFFDLQSLQVPQVQALPLAFDFDFGPLPKPGSPFFLPHPHAAHIYLLTFFLVVGFATFFFPEPSGTQFGTFLPFFIFMPT